MFKRVFLDVLDFHVLRVSKLEINQYLDFLGKIQTRTFNRTEHLIETIYTVLVWWISNALSEMTDVLTLLWFTVQKFNGQPVVGIPMDYWGLWTLRLH